MAKDILITYSSEKKSSKKYDYCISVENLLSQIPRNEVLDTIQRISSLNVPNTGCIAFSIIWQRFTGSQSNNLMRAILFSQQLEQHLDELDVDNGTLVCEESLNESYVRAVEDVAETTSLRATRLGRNGSVFTLSVLAQMMLVFIKISAVIGDWFIARFAALFRERVEQDILYVPPIERLDSSLPAIEALDTKPQTIITEPLWYYEFRSSIKSKLKSYNPTFGSQYLTVFGFVRQIRDVCTIVREVLTVNSFAPDLISAVEKEFDVSIESTITGLVRNHLSNLLVARALIARRSFQRIFTADHVEKVIIGTLDPMGRAIVYEATQQQAQVYHIPHSIATTTPPYPRTEIVQFVSGDWDIEYYERVVPRERWWNWVKTGRPYLRNIAEQYGNGSEDRPTDRSGQDQFNVLLATQPFSLSVRKEFIETMAASFDSDKFKLIVKPHPDEEATLYQDIDLEQRGLRVTTDSLYEEINKSDLTVTVSSNVGLESIVVGTPTICFNTWEPFLFEQTYAIAEEVPLFQSAAELQAFVSGLDSDELSQLWRRQYAFVEQNYCMGADISINITRKIQLDPTEIREPR
jgi:hypothetical protein